MKVVNHSASILFSLGLALVVQQSEGRLLRKRELAYTGTEQCSKKLDLCQAQFEGIPTKAWKAKLSNPDLSEIIDSVDSVDFSHVPHDASLLLRGDSIANVFALFQTLLGRVEKLTIYSTPVAMAVKMVVGVSNVIIGSLIGPVLRLDLRPWIKAISYTHKLIIALPDGFSSVVSVAARATGDFLSNLLHFLINLTRPSGGEADPEADLCMTELFQCQHDTMIMKAMPSLVGATFLVESLEK